MAINANNKIVDTVLSRIDDYTLISKRDINHPLEIENITQKCLSQCGYTVATLKLIYNVLSVKAIEYIYENGLKYLLSEVIY